MKNIRGKIKIKGWGKKCIIIEYSQKTLNIYIYLHQLSECNEILTLNFPNDFISLIGCIIEWIYI